MIFYDAIENDSHPAGEVRVWMRVLRGHPTMCCPAGMTDPDGGGSRGRGHRGLSGGLTRGESRPESIQVAHAPNALDVPVVKPGDPRRVIPAILQTLKTLEQEFQRALLPHVANDSAHAAIVLG